MTHWIDISQPFTKETGHWPGDVPFSYSLSLTKEQTGSVNIGKITTSLHTGTHVDAPFHFDSTGKTIEQLPLDPFIGVARMVDVSQKEHIEPKDLYDVSFQGVKQILLKTSLPNNPNRFPDTIPALDESLATFLKEQGIQLIGVDLPSVDAPTSKTLLTHHAFHQSGIHILENVMLDHVEEGLYELVALPLAIQGADGSPVRAVIKKIQESDLDE